MRYFLNSSANQPFAAGGHSFSFELVGLRGGSWLGILAVDEPAASILAGNLTATVSEITPERYESLKKKSSANQGTSPAWPRPTYRDPSLTVAERAGRLPTLGASSPSVIDHNSTANITAVSLLTTRNLPPTEPLLAVQGGKSRRPL